MRIEISGAIGSGKTSLAKLLLDHGYEIVFEEFKLNPFWKAFYSNPDKYNFETEITFLLQHYHDLRRKFEENNNVVCDFSFVQDLGYAVMGLKEKQLKIFRSIFEYIIDDLGEPKLIIYMKCSPKTLVDRIHIRGRQEELLINIKFLSSLIRFVTNELDLLKEKQRDIIIWEIDTEKIDIINNQKDQSFVLNKISGLIS